MKEICGFYQVNRRLRIDRAGPDQLNLDLTIVLRLVLGCFVVSKNTLIRLNRQVDNVTKTNAAEFETSFCGLWSNVLWLCARKFLARFKHDFTMILCFVHGNCQFCKYNSQQVNLSTTHISKFWCFRIRQTVWNEDYSWKKWITRYILAWVIMLICFYNYVCQYAVLSMNLWLIS